MILEVLWLRCKQIQRALTSIGWLSIVVFPFLIIFTLGIFESASKGSYVLALLMAIIIVAIHSMRNDAKFLFQITDHPVIIRLAEYLSLSIFVASAQWLITGEYKNAIWFVPFSFLIAWMPIPNFKTGSKWWLFPVGWIPDWAFEWRAGLRTSGWIWTILLLIVLLTGQYSPAIPLIYIVLVGFTISSWFDYLEPKEILDVQAGEGNFLTGKIFSHLMLLSIWQLLPVAAGIYFWPDWWYLFAIAFGMTTFMLCFAIFYKYAHYTNERIRLYSQLPTGIFNGSVLIPLLFLISLVYMVIYWRKAVKNLRERYA